MCIVPSRCTHVPITTITSRIFRGVRGARAADRQYRVREKVKEAVTARISISSCPSREGKK